MNRKQFTKELGANLRLARRRQNLSLEAVQAASGRRWSASALGAYERGARNITVEKLAGLAEFYGTDALSLWPGTRKKPQARRQEKPAA